MLVCTDPCMVGGVHPTSPSQGLVVTPDGCIDKGMGSRALAPRPLGQPLWSAHLHVHCEFISPKGLAREGFWVVSSSPSPCRFMVKLAEETDGIIVTNEQLHILMNNSKKLMVKDR